MKLAKLMIVSLALISTAESQDIFTGISWDIGFPVGTTSDFVTKTSYAGFSFEGKRFIDPDATVGLSIGWNHFSLLTTQTVQIQNGAISGTQVRYLNVVPILLNTNYFLGSKNDDFRPFIGMNIGTYHVYDELDIGVVALSNNLWHFGLAPEAGIMYQLDRNMYFLATVRYNYAFDEGTSLLGNDKNLCQYIGINLTLGGIEKGF